MEFSSKEDINAPIDRVFAILSDVDAVERQALRRGVTIRRTTDHRLPDVGMGWKAEFRFRGRKRTTQIEITRFDRPEVMAFSSATGGLQTAFDVELVALILLRKCAVRLAQFAGDGEERATRGE